MSDDREATAHHEAGHAFAHWYYGHEILSATIVPLDNTLGEVKVNNPLADIDFSFDPIHGPAVTRPCAAQAWQALRESACTSFAGEIAEKRFNPGAVKHEGGYSDRGHNLGCRREFELLAYDYLQTEEELVAWSDDPEGSLDKLELELYQEAEALIEKNWPAVQALAAALLEHDTLSGDGVKAILQAAPRAVTVQTEEADTTPLHVTVIRLDE